MTSKDKKKNKPLGVEFVFSAVSGAGAGVFTNPIDVIKVRLQLQGELEARGSYKKVYKNTVHAAYVIATREGIARLQSGIISGVIFQIFLNGFRLGSYKISREFGLTLNPDGSTNIIKTSLVSGTAGCVGAVLGSPFYLIKTQVQAQSAAADIAVGFQHGHAGEWHALKTLWQEAGLAGLYRQWYANIPRVFVGSAAQLTTFGVAEDWFRKFSVFDGRPLFLTFCAAVISGNAIALSTQPLQVVSTRLYNQGYDASGKGLLYQNFTDALYKIWRTEGITGLYKGMVPAWVRMAPHTVICLCFYQQLEKLYYR